MSKSPKHFLKSTCNQGIYWVLVLYKRFLSPFQYLLKVCFGISCECRFYPTCSEYACQCFQRHSFSKATWLTIKRLCRCHPLCVGGYDPVP